MFRKTLSYFTLPLLLLFSGSWENSEAQSPRIKGGRTETAERIVNAPAQSAASLSGSGRKTRSVPRGLVPGPDVIAGDMTNLFQAGFEVGEVGLAVGVTSCNAGNVELSFDTLPEINHPVIAQNFYRMSSGPANDGRFEQIGQAWVKHTYGAEQANDCNFGCIPAGDFRHLGAGCSDTYNPFQSAEQEALGSRAWINPFTGVFPSTAT